MPLLMALAKDCPTLICGEFQGLVKEIDLGCRLFPLEGEPTIDNLSSAISLCLIESGTLKQSTSFSWTDTAQNVVKVFQQCHSGRQSNQNHRYMGMVKPLFHYHYVKSETAVEVSALLLPGFSNVSLEEALKLALEGRISLNEIQVVLKKLCRR